MVSKIILRNIDRYVYEILEIPKIRKAKIRQMRVKYKE